MNIIITPDVEYYYFKLLFEEPKNIDHPHRIMKIKKEKLYCSIVIHGLIQTPFKIDNYCQFDFQIPTTEVYSKTVKEFLTKHPKFYNSTYVDVPIEILSFTNILIKIL